MFKGRFGAGTHLLSPWLSSLNTPGKPTPPDRAKLRSKKKNERKRKGK